MKDLAIRIAYYDIHQLSLKYEAQQQEYVCAKQKECKKKGVVVELEAN